jgi:tetratricopeptide (TPR) repeat protein
MNRKMRRAERRALNTSNRSATQSSWVKNRSASISEIVSARFGEAVRCHQSGKLAEAVALYDRIVWLQPKIPEVHCNRGVALVGLARFDDAEAAYRRAIALNPTFADAYNNLGNLLCEVGRLDEAERALRHAIRINPRCARHHTNLGIIFDRQGRFAEAERTHRDAIALDLQLPEAYNNLGETLRHLDRLDAAERAWRRAILLQPRYPEALANLAIALKSQGKLSEADLTCRQAIALKPDFPQAYNNLGNILLDLGQLDDSERALRQAIALKPHCAEAHSNLGNTLKEQGRLAEAETAHRRAIALKPDGAEAHYNLGIVLTDQDRLPQAETAYRRAISLNPDFADAHNNLGGTMKYLGRFADARRSVEKALHLSPRNTASFLNLSELKRFCADDPDLARMEDLAKSIRTLTVKEQIDLHFALAKAYEDVGRYDDAFQQLLTGNALKRRRIQYDEAAALGELDHIMEVFTPELLQALQGAGEPSTIPVFIVGMPRSGTTLIEQILASHPRVFAAGELPNLNLVAASIGPMAGCPFPFPDVMRHLSTQHLQSVGARYVAEITRLAPEATHVTDKLPSNFRFAGLIHLALPNARIIHAARDPIDTCVSCFSKLFANGQYQTYDLAELGRYYQRYRALMQHWRQVLPAGRMLEVQYEDLIGDVEGQARRIIAHCGLDWHERCLAFHNTDRAVHTASAVQVRQPIYRSAIGRAQPFAAYLQALVDALSASSSSLQRSCRTDPIK